MKTALLASIAFLLFFAQFGAIPTRIDDAVIALAKIDDHVWGDILLVGTFLPILVAAGKAAFDAFKKDEPTHMARESAIGFHYPVSDSERDAE